MCLTPKGIQNLNNTCFANSVLQAVLSVEKFSKGLQDIQRNREKCSAKQAGELWCFTTTLLPQFSCLYLCHVNGNLVMATWIPKSNYYLHILDVCSLKQCLLLLKHLLYATFQTLKHNSPG